MRDRVEHAHILRSDGRPAGDSEEERAGMPRATLPGEMPALPGLPPEALRRRCDERLLAFDTTASLAPLDEVLGQTRAIEALRFGVAIRGHDFNIFAFGPPGLGKHATVEELLRGNAATAGPPPDWCYVHNFADPRRPRALRLPAGRGKALEKDMRELVREARAALAAAFESEDFRTRKDAIEEEVKNRHTQALLELQKEAEPKGIALLRTPVGFVLAPVRGGEPLAPEEFERLPPEERERLRADLQRLEKELDGILRRAPQWHRDGRARMRDLVRQVTTFTVGHLVDEVRSRWTDVEEALRYLDAVRADFVENHAELLTSAAGEDGRPSSMPTGLPDGSPLRRYEVNVLVDHGATKGRPVVYEDHPSYPALVGSAEHLSMMGTLLTDFTLLKPGAFHKANGGYLVLDARKVLVQPFLWEELKRTLRAREIRIRSLGQELGLVSTVSVEPEPIPLDLRVVLVGDPVLYYLLCALDPDFPDLFKVAADFTDRIEWNDESTALYARLVATIARRHELRALDRAAVSRVLEHAARHADDPKKLSLNVHEIEEIVREADHWASTEGAAVVGPSHVQRTIDARIRRADRIRDVVYEQIERGTILVDVRGTEIGQVNGLAVSQLGGFAFARPARITARCRLGKGQLLDIEREVELSGPLHSKGVLILQGFLTGRYALDLPLAMTATLVFEQSYGIVEGDSASAAELYALLSALAELPIRQSIAVTGSVNQRGIVQPIGAVNEKIEGFFDVCSRLGLTGDQGVLIPRPNVQHLMLRQDVVDAVAAGRFHVWPVETIDEGIELLTGVPAGIRGPDGNWTQGSVNARVEARLVRFAEAARAFGGGGDKTLRPGTS